MAKVRPLSEELQRIAREELNEVESRIPEDIEALRTWIQKQPHLKARTDDQFLIAFLRGCKYSLEKAKSKVDHFYTIKTMMPEVFGKKRMDEKTIAFCRAGVYLHLPKPLGPDGPRIRITDYSKWDLKKFKFVDLFRYQTLLMLPQVLQDDHAIVAGCIEVIDLSKLSLSILSSLDLMTVKKLGVFADKATPMRVKGVHLVNAPKEAVTVLNLGRSLMSEKLQNRFHMHKNFEELYKVIPRMYLPTDYGGTNGTIASIQATMEQELLQMNDYFVEEDQYGVNEKLRTGRKISPDSLFGIEGSFRKLEID